MANLEWKDYLACVSHDTRDKPYAKHTFDAHYRMLIKTHMESIEGIEKSADNFRRLNNGRIYHISDCNCFIPAHSLCGARRQSNQG